ncbi:ABC transporter permease [Pseudomonas sp. Pc102]|uniref:ABC transporter permease n=1 Tax=Pseudomonas sp. Pc102 TaxID=2678261 RepID=UPI001BCF6B92|nr:ABC transporter permease [Pseudomonas sp. Pc102]
MWGAVFHYHGLHWTHLLVPLIYLLQIMMVSWLVWITASLTVLFRDFQQAIPVLVLFLMTVPPIGYTSEMVQEGPQGVLLFSPLAWLMELYRACLMKDVVLLEQLGLFTLLACTLFALGGALVLRLKPLFADHV